MSQTGTRFEELTDDARYLGFGEVVDPVSSGRIPAVPVARFGPWRYAAAGTGVVQLDLAPQLGLWDGPATGPGLLANFVRIRPGEHVFVSPNATSQLYYVVEGHGFTAADGHLVRWEAGDFLTLPSTQLAVHDALSDTTLFWVHDEPILRHLGVTASQPKFRPTKFPRARVSAALDSVVRRGRRGTGGWLHVMLANATREQEATVTQVLRAMVALLPSGDALLPHRHQSMGVVLVVDALPGCFTLLGHALDGDGQLVSPVRVDWEVGGAFVIPPGMWHTHVNQSGAAARVVHVEDGGLQTYLRSLDVRFPEAGATGG